MYGQHPPKPSLSAQETDDPQLGSPPLVSIGLPVFNGDRYLAGTIRSILGQTFADFELIIGDNASADGTQALCEAYAAADPRIRYFRNPRNVGAGPNYDLCFHRSRGRYFKWAAHDDMLARDYLTAAVAALERQPDAVLCTTGITEIGPDDEVRRVYANDLPGVDAASPAHRLAAVIHHRHQCEDFFGLYRREALVGSGLHDTYSGSDRVLLAELALRGPWTQVPDPVFLHREHPHRYTRAVLLVDRRQAALWQDTAAPRAPSTQFHLVVYRHYWRLVGKTVPGFRDRLACRLELLRWWFTGEHFTDVVRDALQATHPVMPRAARAVKRSVFGLREHSRPGGLPKLE